ncbi:hypothetical protein ACFLYK_04155 [Candidatus Cloacimonadota bacterium]
MIIIAMGVVLINTLKVSAVGIVFIAAGGYIFIRNIDLLKK